MEHTENFNFKPPRLGYFVEKLENSIFKRTPNQ